MRAFYIFAPVIYNRMHRIPLFFVCFFITVTAFSQTHTTEVGLQTDNDAYLAQGSDRYYTNGFFLFYRHALPVTESTSLKNKIVGLELGQKIFNPQTGRIPSPSYVDRPFAGYLYAGINLNLLYKNESNLKLGVQTGMVGPASLAKQAQTFIHNTFGLYQILGWEYQIKNNFQLNLSAEYNRLLTRASIIDLSVATYANLGTGFTGAGAGALLRLGNFNQLFNSESTQSASIVGKTSPLHKHELFFYYKPLLNVVGYDATIQGGIFDTQNNGLEVTAEIKPFIFSQELGINYVTTRWIFNASAYTRTIETNYQIAPHQWGSVRILYRFN
jgi:lipid A 3-O-deacylase